MMDGRVEKISRILAENNFSNIPIMSYSVKYSSSFYGPFRDAADSAPKFGDRKSYQMDFRYVGDAMSEVRSDLEQGADMVIVKPALAYLDILSKVKETFDVPVIAYSVSGEYSMVKAAAINGWINEKNIVMEQMYAFKRAGANAVITYFAKNIARYLDEEISVINI
jgi:porphobilinogen synthase